MHRIASYQSILDWEKEEHGYSFDKEAVVFIEGVVPAISAAIQAFTKEGCCLNQYAGLSSICPKCQAQSSKIDRNSLIEKDGLFQIDFDQLEKDIVEQEGETLCFV